jgi:hypothetical protein
MREKATTRTMDGGREGSTMRARTCAETCGDFKRASDSFYEGRDASLIDDADEARVHYRYTVVVGTIHTI